MYKPHTVCRACGAPPARAEGIKADAVASELLKVVDLGLQPLANDFCQGNDERAGYAPLEVMLCPKCDLAQLSVTVRPDILYSKYAYRTSQSKTMLDHFGSLVAELNPEHKPLKVIEIGSNDGFFLHYWLTHVAHSQILGIDPADNLVQIARDRGVATIEGLFDHQTAKTASMAIPEPDLIFARHVFCHIDNWQEFTNNLTRLTAKNTTVAIEVPYVLDMLEKGSFDQVYHEHLSYLSIRSMKALLHGSALYLHKVVRLPVHGGVILLLIKRRDCGQEADISVLKSLRGEYCGSKEWQRFAEKAKDQVAMLSNLVRELVNKGKRVCGLGASAKATVWMNACKFTKREISYVMDSTANKVYRSIPGTNIPVLNEGTHIFDACDYCIIFAWNFAEEILEREKQYVDLGGRFIVPIPELKIVPKEPGLLFGQLQE